MKGTKGKSSASAASKGSK